MIQLLDNFELNPSTSSTKDAPPLSPQAESVASNAYRANCVAMTACTASPLRYLSVCALLASLLKSPPLAYRCRWQ